MPPRLRACALLLCRAREWAVQAALTCGALWLTVVTLCAAVCRSLAPVHPLMDVRQLEQQFTQAVQLGMAGAAADVVAAAAPLFHAAAPAVVAGDPVANQQAHARAYMQALVFCAATSPLAAPDDTIQRIPADPLFAAAHSALGGRFRVEPAAAFGAANAPYVPVLMRQTALNAFTGHVNAFVATRPVPSPAGVVALGLEMINLIQPRMLVLGPQGMGKVGYLARTA